jgi:hypothetical protein
MKKKLEAELISIAHRILKLKNKSEIDQLYLETQKLYEKLSVLKFVEENFADVKPTIGKAGAEEILETAFDKKEEVEPVQDEVMATAPAKGEVPAEQPVNEKKPEDKPEANDPEEEDKEEEKIQEPEQPETEKLDEVLPNEQALETPEEKETDELVAEAEVLLEDEKLSLTDEISVPEAGIDFEQPETVEEVAAAMPEEAKDNELFKPAFEWAFEAKSDKQEENKTSITEPVQAETSKSQSGQIAFEDLLGAGYKDPVFIKPGDVSQTNEMISETNIPAEDNRIEPKEVIPITRRDDKVPVFKMNNEAVSLNDRISKGITVGLNDRIAFVKNLFNNSNEDYNRVLSQLITFDTYADALDFIDNMVKPDYNNWEGKDEYAQRFMEIIERKFS